MDYTFPFTELLEELQMIILELMGIDVVRFLMTCKDGGLLEDATGTLTRHKYSNKNTRLKIRMRHQLREIRSICRLTDDISAFNIRQCHMSLNDVFRYPNPNVYSYLIEIVACIMPFRDILNQHHVVLKKIIIIITDDNKSYVYLVTTRATPEQVVDCMNTLTRVNDIRYFYIDIHQTHSFCIMKNEELIPNLTFILFDVFSLEDDCFFYESATFIIHDY